MTTLYFLFTGPADDLFFFLLIAHLRWPGAPGPGTAMERWPYQSQSLGWLLDWYLPQLLHPDLHFTSLKAPRRPHGAVGVLGSPPRFAFHFGVVSLFVIFDLGGWSLHLYSDILVQFHRSQVLTYDTLINATMSTLSKAFFFFFFFTVLKDLKGVWEQ